MNVPCENDCKIFRTFILDLRRIFLFPLPMRSVVVVHWCTDAKVAMISSSLFSATLISNFLADR